MKIHRLAITSLTLALCTAALPLEAQSLRGSRASLDLQNQQARNHDFTYLDGRPDVTRFVGAGLLVPIKGGPHYKLDGVSYEVARPEVRLFIERLSVQYHRACGSPLVVTSLTRPRAGQPWNASARSVHPTGMALDLRIPAQKNCRSWLESTLLSLETAQVLDATRERNPAHYHVAVFPEAYVAYVAKLQGRSSSNVLASARVEPTAPRSARAQATPDRHTVRRGETLWRIAQSYDTTPAAIKRANKLRSSTIRPGQRLLIP